MSTVMDFMNMLEEELRDLVPFRKGCGDECKISFPWEAALSVEK